MKLPSVLIAALAATVGGAMPATAARPVAAASPAAHVTHSVVVRPVTAAGHAASGFHVKVQHVSIDCSSADPSPGAIDRDIELCSPSAAYAIACWKAATPGRALCMRDPRSHRLSRIRLDGSFAKTAAINPRWRAPLALVLSDGTKCSIRDGGAWGMLRSHPKWTGAYSCDKHGVVWAPPHAKHYGVDESSAAWTVHTASGSGHGRLTVRHVARAYFVGTATG